MNAGKGWVNKVVEHSRFKKWLHANLNIHRLTECLHSLVCRTSRLQFLIFTNEAGSAQEAREQGYVCA